MTKQIFQTSESPKIVISANGDLVVKGHDDLEVVVRTSDEESTVVEQQEDLLTVRSDQDCNLRVPRQAQIEITRVGGDATLKALDGELKIEQVSGNLQMRSVASTQIGIVDGALEVKNVMGDLIVNRVSGNLTARDIQGKLSVDRVAGNLAVYDVDGGLSARVGGNAALEIDPAPGQTYEVEVGGNLACHVPDDLSAEVHIRKASTLLIKLLDGPEVKNIKAPYDFTVGEGDASLSFSAGGNLILASRMPSVSVRPNLDFEFDSEIEGLTQSVSQQIVDQIDVQMQMIEQQLNAQMANLSVTLGAAGLSADQIERIQERARLAGERASTQAEEKVRHAQERLQRKMATMEARLERKARAAEIRSRRQERPWGIPWGSRDQEAPPQPSATEEERTMILQMLEQKKISLEEAEQLLSVLED